MIVRSRTLKYALVALLATIVPFLTNSQSALAAVWTGRPLFTGYFTNLAPRTGGLCEYANCENQGYVLPGPISGDALGANINSVDTFIALLQGYDASGDLRNMRGSAFIVHSMLGRSGDEANANGGIAISQKDWTDLRNRMNNVDINWNDQWSTSTNTYMQAGNLDVALSNEGQFGSAIVMRERGTGVVKYVIFRDCANPDGNIGTGLPEPPPPSTAVSCGTLSVVSSTGGAPRAGTMMSLRGMINYSGGPNPSTINTPKMTIQGPDTIPPLTPSITSGNNSPVVIDSGEFEAPTNGTYTVSWTANINEKQPVTPSCTGTFNVTSQTGAQCGGLVTVPTNPQVGDNVDVIGTTTYSGGPSPAAITNPNMSLSGPTGNKTLTLASPPGTSSPLTFRSNGIPMSSPGEYTVTWKVNINELPVTCTGTFGSLAHPFFQVKNGDTVAGASFATSAKPCSTAPHNPNAGIVSWNNGPSAGYSGAGDQYAAFAMGYIQGFAENQGNGNGRSPTSLAFANDSALVTNPGGDLFGGLFGGPTGAGGVADCIDYWQKMPTGLPAPNNLSTDTGSFYKNGSMTIGNTVIQSGQRLTLYVKGDVTISGDIKYQDNSTSWTTVNDIPSFKLIVNGRIFIDKGVTGLDGTYVAVPNAGFEGQANSLSNPLAGTILTCTNGSTPYDMTVNSASAAAYVSACKQNNLEVNGSFVANQIYLLRAQGSASTSGPAETFTYIPEIWLAPSGDGGSIGQNYKTIQGLPPVL